MALNNLKQKSALESHQKLRVMVVDDSAVARGLIARWLEAEEHIEVVARCRTGQVALDMLAKSKPDVCILDIEMPEMDGLTALPQLLKKNPDLIVVMASALTQRNARESMQALSLGAMDYVPKPNSNSALTTNQDFRNEIVNKTIGLASAAFAKKHGFEAPYSRRSSEGRKPLNGSYRRKDDKNVGLSKTPGANNVRSNVGASPVVPIGNGKGLRSVRPQRHNILAFGSSTGGPQALQTVFAGLRGKLDNVIVVITQHMPKTFTTILAEHLGRVSEYPAKEVSDREELKPGSIYVAPGGLHLILEKGPKGPIGRLLDTAPVNYCKPAVDPLFNSLANHYAKNTLGVVLTGMGQDGARGAVNLSDAGSNVIAQDEESSIVWGMPGATFKAGGCCHLSSLDKLSGSIVRMLEGGRP